MLYFVCDLCPYLCTADNKIKEHLESAHVKNKTVALKAKTKFKCPGCQNVFFHKLSLRSHLIHDHGVIISELKPIIQAIVQYSSEDKPEKKAVRVYPENNQGASSKELHLTEMEVKRPIKLEEPVKHNIAVGIIGRLISSKQSCTVAGCKVALQSVENINYHISCHKDNGFTCLVCNEYYVFWKQLSSHLWRLHKIDMELYSCDKCSYKSVSLAKLNNVHKLIHSDVKAYVCNVCKKAFKNSKQLRNHKITHKSERMKYSCGICSKPFVDKRQLKIHMNVVHEKIKPFLCNYCGYKGPSRSSLKMHIRQHTGEKPFACDSCTYTSSDHNSLRRHKLRHTGQKPYKCSFCSYACIQSSTYKVHIKTKHPGLEKDLMFTCQECQFRSVKKEMFVAHMITVHNQKPQNE